MSSSFRRKAAARACLAGALAGAPFAGSSAMAAEVFFQPSVSLSTSYNNNLQLDPATHQGGEGYYADAATLIGIASPQSETTLAPRLLYNYYPTVAGLNRLEEFLNLNSRYSWQRDRFNITGYFDHRDDVNAEQPQANYNTVNPGIGNTTPGTGLIQVGTTRNWLILDPTYTHLLTPLSSVGVGAEYQRLTYSPDDTSGHVSFNYYLAKAFYAFTYDARTDFTFGVFGSKYLAATIDAQSTSGGLSFGTGYNWTQQIHSDLVVQYQRTKFEETDPRTFSQTSNPWGATLSTVYKGSAASYRVDLGRTIAPSSQGGLFTTDQIRGQYDRDVTQRLHFNCALRAFRDRTTTASASVNDNTRTYTTATVGIQYMLSPTLFVGGGYSYIYQKYHFDPTAATANVVTLNISYRALGRQR